MRQEFQRRDISVFTPPGICSVIGTGLAILGGSVLAAGAGIYGARKGAKAQRAGAEAGEDIFKP